MDSGEEGTAGYICRISGLSEQSMKQVQTIRGLLGLAPGSAEKEHNHLSLFTELCFLLPKKRKKKKTDRLTKTQLTGAHRNEINAGRTLQRQGRLRLPFSPISAGTHYRENRSQVKHLDAVYWTLSTSSAALLRCSSLCTVQEKKSSSSKPIWEHS